MTIPEAFTQLLQSEKYKELSNVIGNLRVIKTRFKKNKLSITTQVELLEANGYVITADKVERKIVTIKNYPQWQRANTITR